MKLINRIISRLSVALLLLMAVWAAFFYGLLLREINDETDDALERYSEFLIMRALAGKELPGEYNGTNNGFYLSEVSAQYAQENKRVHFYDHEVYLDEIQETEPARVQQTIFQDNHGRYFQLTVYTPTFEREDLQRTILFWIVILYVILLLAVIAVNAWILSRSFRPLYILLDWLDGVVLGREVPPLENRTDIPEFRKLNEGMVRHARRNNQIYEEQRIFIGNAAHELQTPIAVCKNRLENLTNDPGLSEYQLGEILKTKQTLEYLSRVNKTLLLLSKIENRQFPESAVVRINPLINELLDDFNEVYAYTGIRVERNLKKTLRIRMNPTLATVLCSNLIKNGFVHTPKQGTLKIRILKNGIIFSNTAENGPLPADHIFRRFYKEPGKEHSTGLGLPLVDSICRMYSIRILYEHLAKQHQFSLIFPVRMIL